MNVTKLEDKRCGLCDGYIKPLRHPETNEIVWEGEAITRFQLPMLGVVTIATTMSWSQQGWRPFMDSVLVTLGLLTAIVMIAVLLTKAE